MTITRRDFLNGAALSIAAGMLPTSAAQAAAEMARDHTYPPALTGLRGNHAGSYALAHSVGREGVKYRAVTPREVYDLVVVGGGISGLATAWFYRRKYGADKRILILENHDDFGGHARRNEFTVRGKHLVSYGGSERFHASMLDQPAVATLLSALGVEPRHRIDDDSVFAQRGLERAIFFNREHFGRDQLLRGDPLLQADRAAVFLSQAPLPAEDQRALQRLLSGTVNFLEGMSDAERSNYLRRTSYAAFLKTRVGLSVAGLRFFRSRTADAYALDSEAVSVWDALAIGLPAGAGVPSSIVSPYLGRAPGGWLRFPDGNAGLARLLVRDLIPNVAPAGPADSVAQALFNYSKLDQEQAKVRLRLNSLVVGIEHDRRLSRVTYGVDGALHAAETTHVVLAGYHMMIPFIVPTLPAPQKAALRQAVKAPVIYTKVALDNWRAFDHLKVRSIHAPTQRYTDLKLERPAGNTPDDPVVLHMSYVPMVPDSGMPARDRFRAGRAQLLATPFATLERDVFGQLDRILGPAGFSAQRDVRALTVNRWSHGYAYMPNSLYDEPEATRQRLQLASTPDGRTTIANSDASGSPSVGAAITQALRAVDALG